MPRHLDSKDDTSGFVETWSDSVKSLFLQSQTFHDILVVAVVSDMCCVPRLLGGVAFRQPGWRFIEDRPCKLVHFGRSLPRVQARMILGDFPLVPTRYFRPVVTKPHDKPVKV